jgi:CMP-N,N'-diacetyllegionaminic acid synthase
MDILALITARGGSKGLPQKNLRPLAGKPLIAWTIEVALASRGLRRVIVSTDDEEIARVSQQWGAEVPFVRPRELAQDNSDHIAVVEHSIHWLDEHEKTFPEFIMLLQPTSPLRTVEDIETSIKIAQMNDAIAVVSVCEMKSHPYLSKRILDDGRLVDFIPFNGKDFRRQVLPTVYAPNGAIYLNRCQSLFRERTFIPQGTYAYVMPPERSLDIDSPWDFHLVELILRRSYERKTT